VTEFCFETINWSPYFGYRDSDLPRLARAASEAGYRWISFDQPILDAHGAQGGSLATLRKLLDDEGLRTLAVHSAALGEDPQEAIAACRPLAESAQQLGAPYVHVGIVAPLGEALHAATNAAAAIAREAGASLAVEFLPFLEIASIEQCRSLLRATETEGSGIVVDSWHFFHGPDDWVDLESLSGAEIAYVQFDDHPPLESTNLLSETTQRRVYPGDGTFELERFARTIRNTGFDGVVGLELLSAAHRALPVEGVARELLAASKRAWSADAPHAQGT
jgi:sugar phosphate isomerase/epimerase